MMIGLGPGAEENFTDISFDIFATMLFNSFGRIWWPLKRPGLFL